MFHIKYLLPFSFLLFFIIPPSGNVGESDQIAWAEDVQIEWSDFKGKAENNSTLDAFTMLGISLEVLAQKDGVVDMGVFGYFEKKKSWVKSKEQSAKLLNHERKHFDLCEIYRRKLIKKLESKTYAFDNFSDEVGDIFNKNFAAYTKEQSRYDHETNHSQKEEQQAKWNTSIAKELLRLKKYDKIAAELRVE